MAQAISQIRTDIEHTKGNISQTMSELEGRFNEMKDVRGTVQRYPLPSIAVAFGIGLLVSGAMTAPLLYRARHLLITTITGALTGFVTQQVQQRLPGYRFDGRR